MISNFQIKQGASVPYLEVQVTKDGMVSMYTQAPVFGCTKDGDNPNAVDLTNVVAVKMRMYKCGRTPVEVGLSGQAVIADAAKGIVQYRWHPLDTSVPGHYYCVFEFTFSDNSLFKWPYQNESLTIEVFP